VNALHNKTIDLSTPALPSAPGSAAQMSSAYGVAVGPRRGGKTVLPFENWRRRSDQWGRLMVAAQNGEVRAYEQLFRELDAWLRRYYARRLPRAAAEDARQEALLAILAKPHAYTPSRSFGAWVAAIARYKWIDYVRSASRVAVLALRDEIPIEDHEHAVISAIVVDDLLARLTPAQASVIRLVKLQGLSIEDASIATGQSTALVKVNIHRGLKRLASLVAGDSAAPTTSTNLRAEPRLARPSDRRYRYRDYSTVAQG
jgi:RNA polymerase sigma factor (sigma-70 family)